MQDDIVVLKKLFERNVLDLLVKHRRLSERLRNDRMLTQLPI
jgi:hypothetical protein